MINLDFRAPPNKCADPAWFGFVAVLRRDLQGRLPAYLEFLTRHKVENRPIISGNFVHQPAIQTLGLSVDPKDTLVRTNLARVGFSLVCTRTAYQTRKSPTSPTPCSRLISQTPRTEKSCSLRVVSGLVGHARRCRQRIRRTERRCVDFFFVQRRRFAFIR